MNAVNSPGNAPSLPFMGQVGKHKKDGSNGGAAQGAGGADGADLSGIGQLLGQLQQLQQQDPSQFKQLLSGIASNLRSAAQQSTGTAEGQLLSSLAQKISSVANGGSLTQVLPKQHHHHGGGSRAEQAYSQAQQNAQPDLLSLLQGAGASGTSATTGSTSA